MSPLSRRPATTNDLPAIRRLVYAVAAEYGFVPEPEGVDADLHAESDVYFRSGSLLEVLEDDAGRLCGVLGVVPQGSDRCELRKLYLSRDTRGRGEGHHLLERAIEFARKSGASRLVLQTSSRLIEAARLYERAGFVAVTAEDAHSTTCDRHYELWLDR